MLKFPSLVALCVLAATIGAVAPAFADELVKAPPLALEAIPTAAWTPLLDAKLSRFELWMGVPHTSVTGLPAGTSQGDDWRKGEPLGLNNDPKKVFSMIEENGKPVLKISGEIYGGLTTLSEHENFHLSAQVKFGDKKWAPRLNAPRDNGLLYHATGEHGTFWKVWKSSVEFQVQENDMGDLYLLAGPRADARFVSEGESKSIWDPMQSLKKAGQTKRSANYENPHGEWTTVEIYAIGRHAVHLVNGRVVMAIENIRSKEEMPLSKGQIQIQCEGAEAYYRDLKIRSVSEFPPAISAAAGFVEAE